MPLFLAVALLVGVGALVRYRMRSAVSAPQRSFFSGVLQSLLVAWLGALLYVTLRAGPEQFTPGRQVSLVPFADMWDLVHQSVSWQVPVGQIAGNVLLFAPFGFLLSSILGGYRGRVWAIGTGLAIALEVTQYLLVPGRVASVDDVLLASAGCALGVVLAHPLVVRLAPRTDPDRTSAHVNRGL